MANFTDTSFRIELADLYEFKSDSDSEIVVALYLRYGIHFLSKLRGEFALCLYDEKGQMLFAARDRYGIKPLFWTVGNNRLLLASEAKAFLPLGWKAKWDVRSIVEDGWLHDQRTLFKGVSKVSFVASPAYFCTVCVQGA
jgi:asparagine synthase (glutamine-hydrolysing)